jgi:MYXO-CTERM domain-containing protein
VTYSIVAVDLRSGEVGGAGTSCLGGSDVYVIYRGVPGRGVVHAQARYSAAAGDRAAQLLAEGSSAPEALAAVIDPVFDRNVSVRQYGIVDALGNSAGYTGPATMAFADDRQGTSDGFAYSVQGNILTSARVLEQAAAAFESSNCDLAERLMQALRAGAVGGEGDSRCTPDGIPADSAFLQVEQPGTSAGGYLSLRVESSGTADPLPLLQAELDDWRSQHPCPTGATGGTAGAAGAAGTTAGAGSSAAGAGTAAAGNPGATSGAEPDSGGCGCGVVGAPDNAAVWLLVGCLLIVRRRRRAPGQL